MKKGDYLDALLRSPKTVFSTHDIGILWRESNRTRLRSRLHYAVQQGKLHHIRRGLYAKDADYEPLELAVKVNTPSYISFETVLSKNGLIFQYYDSIFIASYLSKSIVCDEHQLVYRKLKSSILHHPAGIEQQGEWAMASTERALLDLLYINKAYHIDNLSVINWQKAFSLVPLYNNQRLKNELVKLQQNSENQHVK